MTIYELEQLKAGDILLSTEPTGLFDLSRATYIFISLDSHMGYARVICVDSDWAGSIGHAYTVHHHRLKRAP